MKTVSVVILNFNGEKLLQQFLPSVIKHSGNARIIIADNGSTDQSKKLVSSDFPFVEWIQLEKNYGFCGGYNRALQQVDSKYYVLLNSDVEVTPGWLNALITVLDRDEQIAAVQPKILSYHNKDHFEYAGAGGGFVDAFGYPFCRGRLFDFTETDTGQYDDTREVFWASGACLAIRSEVYRALGGLDETFFAHMEEIDLCWRIQRSGKQVYYCGSGTVYHVGAGTLPASNPRKTYYNFRNGLSLIVKHLPPGQLLFKLQIRILLDYLAMVKFMSGGSLSAAKAVLQAHADFFRNFKETWASRKQLRDQYPYSSRHIYGGLIPLEYYLLGKKKIMVNNPK